MSLTGTKREEETEICVTVCGAERIRALDILEWYPAQHCSGRCEIVTS